MNKIKHWDVSVLGNKSAVQKENMDFYSRDTDAHLRVKLTDAGLEPTTATFTLLNRRDGSLVSEPVDMDGDIATYHMREEVIAHAGDWQLQVVFHTEKDYTTRVLNIHVGGYLLDDNLPKLEIIENWAVFKAQANELLVDMTDTQVESQALIQAMQEASGAETIRQTNEHLRQENETIRQQRSELMTTKVAKVDKELQDYKKTISGVNVNQEAKQTAEGRRVVSLPKTAGEGHGEFGLQGLTATNLIEGREVQPESSVSFDAVSGNQYYDSFRNSIATGNGTAITLTNDTENEVDILAINLTQTFGAGNEPTKEECDRIFANYFEGTQSVNGNVRVTSGDSILYLNAPKLRSLPNGVRDEIVGDTLVKRVSDEFMFDNTIYTGVPVVKDNTVLYAFSAENVKMGGGIIPFSSSTILQGKTYDSLYRDADSEGVSHHSTTATLRLQIKKERLSSLDETGLQEFLSNNPFYVYYQLAEPEIIPLHPSGSLITQPSGTVYIEDVVADVATYSDSALIGRTELLIKELDQLSVMDFETGGERKLDVSKAVISTDKLSFTHPDLANGDIVFFEYYYDEESTDGLASVEYFDSRYTIKDSVTDKHYKWSISIADGTPKIDLEEV